MTPTRRDVVVVEGPDAVSFLQGQCSQDVAALAVGASAWTLVLQPAGKVDGFARATRVADDVVVLDTDAGHGPALLARLQRFKLRVRAELRAVEGWSVGPEDGPGRRVVGWWGEGAMRLRDAAEATAPEAGGDERERIEAGWPALGAELTAETIPAEAGIVGVAASFTKGCYTGQELVARIDSRGNHVPRHLRRLRVSGPGAVAAGEGLVLDGREVGRVTSSVGDVALGYVARAVEVGALVVGAGGAAVIVEPQRPAAGATLGPTAG